MRYRDTGDYENMGAPVDDNLMFISIIVGIVLGIGFVAAGIRLKRYWMVIWGAGLIVSSLSYFVMRTLGYF
jgi:hypothetical protein